MKTKTYFEEWQESARDAAAQLELFASQLEDGIDGEELQAVARRFNDEGLSGWLDEHPLDIDKLYDILVEDSITADN